MADEGTDLSDIDGVDMDHLIWEDKQTSLVGLCTTCWSLLKQEYVNWVFLILVEDDEILLNLVAEHPELDILDRIIAERL